MTAAFLEDASKLWRGMNEKRVPALGSRDASLSVIAAAAGERLGRGERIRS